jgi:hypothetical protein
MLRMLRAAPPPARECHQGGSPKTAKKLSGFCVAAKDVNGTSRHFAALQNLSAIDSQLNRSTQHFILEGKDRL